MFVYDKKLQYPVRIQNTNPKLASIIMVAHTSISYNIGTTTSKGAFALTFIPVKVSPQLSSKCRAERIVLPRF